LDFYKGRDRRAFFFTLQALDDKFRHTTPVSLLPSTFPDFSLVSRQMLGAARLFGGLLFFLLRGPGSGAHLSTFH